MVALRSPATRSEPLAIALRPAQRTELSRARWQGSLTALPTRSLSWQLALSATREPPLRRERLLRPPAPLAGFARSATAAQAAVRSSTLRAPRSRKWGRHAFQAVVTLRRLRLRAGAQLAVLIRNISGVAGMARWWVRAAIRLFRALRAPRLVLGLQILLRSSLPALRPVEMIQRQPRALLGLTFRQLAASVFPAGSCLQRMKPWRWMRPMLGALSFTTTTGRHRRSAPQASRRTMLGTNGLAT